MSKKRKRVPPAKKMATTNIVSMCTLVSFKKYIPIDTVRKAIHGKFSKKIFPAVVSRLRETKVTLCWFSSRCIVCTGSRTRDDAIISLNLAAYQASKQLGTYYKVLDMDVTNIVTAGKLGYRLNMQKIDKAYSSQETGWRPKVFAGMKIDTKVLVPKTEEELSISGGIVATETEKEVKVTYIVFENGNVNVTGIKLESHVPYIEKQMHQMFAEYRIKE